MKIIKVYVGCALTHASSKFKNDIYLLKHNLKSMKGVIILEFIGLENGTATDVYNHDVHGCVKDGELIIAECSYPSTGLGWELGTAVEKHRKHVFAVARDDAKVTRLVLGAACERNPNYSFQTYNSFAGLLDLCIKKIKELQMSE